MTVALPDVAKKLFDSPVHAVLTTLNRDGSPQSTVIWLKRDGDDLLFSTVRGRVKTRNMERDPRISICAYDPAQPYSYVTVEGAVSLSDDPDDLIGELGLKYTGEPWTHDAPGTRRVVCRVTPSRVIFQ